MPMATEHRTSSDVEVEENWDEAWDEDVPEAELLSSLSFTTKNKDDVPDVKVNDFKGDHWNYAIYQSISKNLYSAPSRSLPTLAKRKRTVYRSWWNCEQAPFG